MLCACFALTAAALRPSVASALRSPLGGPVQRARRLTMQEQGLPVGWSSAYDATRGATYYVNEQTGESQWEPPPQQGDYALQGGHETGGYALQGLYETAQPLPSGWARSFDEASGAAYYVNERTGESQWEPPSPELSSAQPAAAQQPAYSQPGAQKSAQKSAQAVWRMVSASGWGPRFAGTYKLRLGDEGTHPNPNPNPNSNPKEYLGRYDMDLQKPTRPWVSRKQCLVYVSADGAANLVSCGQYPQAG